MDNFLATGLGEAVEAQRENARQEKAELETVKSALGQEFPQQEELALARENHNSIIRELQRMQADANYVSTWTPKTSLTDTQPTVTEVPPKEERGKEDSIAAAPPAAPQKEQHHKLKYGEGEGRTEYLVTNQHNGYTLKEGYVLRRTYFNSHVGSLGSRLYEDGKWHSTTTAPQGVKLRLFASLEEGLAAAREDARDADSRRLLPPKQRQYNLPREFPQVPTPLNHTMTGLWERASPPAVWISTANTNIH
ncbi:MAG: hypothetical protein ACLSHC_05470 [Bilophila wadsworthia]